MIFERLKIEKKSFTNKKNSITISKINLILILFIKIKDWNIL